MTPVPFALSTSKGACCASFASAQGKLRCPEPNEKPTQIACLANRFCVATSKRIAVDRKVRICNLIYVYRIRFAVSVVSDLKSLTAYRRSIILETIGGQLSHEPTAPTKNRKLLVNLIPPWDAVPPIWELRVEEYRVFYDVSEEERTVFIRAIRRKPPGKKTEEIL